VSEQTRNEPRPGAVDAPPADESGRVEQAAARTGRPPSRLAQALASPFARNASLAVVLVVICVIGMATTGWVGDGARFATKPNVLAILRYGATVGVVSIGMTFVIIGGGIDLSVGAIVALSSVWATTLATQAYGPTGMVFTALVVATAIGLVNGLLVAYGRIVPFIVTLAMLAAARGLAELISDKQTQRVTEPGALGFTDFFGGDVLGLPMIVLLFVVVAAVGWVVLNRTTFGRRTFAVGGNAEAARLAGINVQRHTMLLYALLGLCCGIAAIMITARTTAGSSTHGTYYELEAIAAVVIGGTLLSGGRGTMVGTVIGVLIFATLSNVFTLNNLDVSRQAVAKGVIIVVAVLFQQRLARSTGAT
jgi:ribose transport system permease protein